MTQAETIRLSPPPVLLLETPEPVWRGETNSDLLDYLLELRGALRACNTDKRALGEWAGDAENK